MNRWEQIEGSPFPLGATWIAEDRDFNFAIYSKHAETVRLVLYSESEFIEPVYEMNFDYLKNKSGPIWHCRVSASDAAGAKYYAYRVDGPISGDDVHWHHFDFSKILLDPYARSIFFPKAFSREAARQPGDNSGKAPLGLLPTASCPFDWKDDIFPRHEHDLVIYELHVRGFTNSASSNLEEYRRGTFSGVIDKIPYLVELGVTAVELMPVFQFDPGTDDYWGYMPLSFFAPHHAYSVKPDSCQQQNEFREMVKSLHAAGIEVILDVVYNHTCEGDHRGPTFSLKGIDSSTAYMMTNNPAAPFADYSGCGNTVHTANRAMRRMIVESLCYWDSQMHVDGFRFDLASVFTRNSNGTIDIENAPIIDQIGTDVELSNNRLIAEPWDAGGEFQLGRKFPGQRWMQWNARYRDTIQKFVRGDPGLVGDLMRRLYGSDDLFPDDKLHAYQPPLSVNYITSHDGMAMYDLVSYDAKRNWANGHNNSDGTSDYSSNYGWNGDDNLSPEILRLRKQQIKNFACLLFMSNGTPMLRMGDEFMQTQDGNNNPYNQDNETTWLDWSRLEAHRDIFRFFKCMIAFRKTHPSISRSRFWRNDVRWYGATHLVDMSESSKKLAFCLHGGSQADVDIYTMINAGLEPVTFGIFEGVVGNWRRVVDTSRTSPEDFLLSGEIVDSVSFEVADRSIVVLVSKN
ncbi:MAG: isoamylase [Pirellulaceae bacterium]|nr:isoamylase [Pirellulaceae bacterium]